MLTKRINRRENSNFGFQCCFKMDEIQYYFKLPFFIVQFMKGVLAWLNALCADSSDIKILVV